MLSVDQAPFSSAFHDMWLPPLLVLQRLQEHPLFLLQLLIHSREKRRKAATRGIASAWGRQLSWKNSDYSPMSHWPKLRHVTLLTGWGAERDSVLAGVLPAWTIFRCSVKKRILIWWGPSRVCSERSSFSSDTNLFYRVVRCVFSLGLKLLNDISSTFFFILEHPHPNLAHEN